MSDINLPPLGTIEKNAKTFARDLTERVLSSALGGFVGGLVVTQPLNGSMWYTAATAGAAAGVSVVKGLIALLVGDRSSASLAKGV
ncbi:hypothetical protein ACIOC1_00455 [Streptomyces sp. NPDC088197]|uniref:hypothetical protein n=1 Tax=unclassified Streptomyces TaxID=2593676 RepID=UPI00382378E6